MHMGFFIIFEHVRNQKKQDEDLNELKLFQSTQETIEKKKTEIALYARYVSDH